ncbi:MAG TPA: phosphoribosylformylglycinamidine cyclo-ligase [Armatimonadota bacterium]|nr:phosphoribosylformylglycinamidine cyclo-ligase [Armatimonadota bacterium]
MNDGGLTYEESGVADTASAIDGLLGWVNRTLSFRKGRTGDNCLEIGYYANVLDLGHGVALAISTDGVGTKILIAEMMGRYDTIGIDCVAMNVNDLICVGAEPVAMLDYLAVEKADPAVLEAIGKGLYAGAAEANISIPGGELAQLGAMIRGLAPGKGVDLAGTCIGLVMRGGRILMGQGMEPGDRIVGVASSGIHSNGLTLAREALFERQGLTVNSRPGALAGSLGEELLTPTRIYVRPALEMIRNIPGLRALAHITSDGFLNLLRIPGDYGYQIESLPPTPPIFSLIQEAGEVAPEEMYRVFNMGIGLCAVVAASEAEDVLRICRDHQLPAWLIGRVTDGAREVVIHEVDLRGRGDRFERS